MNKILAGVGKVARVGVIVASTGCGIQVGCLHSRVRTAASRRHGGNHAVGCADVGVALGLRRILAVASARTRRVGKDTADTVVSAVEKVHVRVPGLVLITAPAVEHVACVRVQVNEPTDLGVCIKHPLDVLGLGLREGAGSVVRLRASRGGGDAGLHAGRKEVLEVPEEVEVAVQIHAHGSARVGVAVLSPAAVGRLIIGNSIGVAQRNEDNSGGQGGLDLRVGVCLGSVRKANVVLVGVQQIRDEVQHAVHGSALSSMDVAVEEDTVGIVAGASGASNLGSEHSGALVGLVRGLKRCDSVRAREALQTALDLVDVQERAEGGGGLRSQSSWRCCSGTESIAGANGRSIARLAADNCPHFTALALFGEKTSRCH